MPHEKDSRGHLHLMCRPGDVLQIGANVDVRLVSVEGRAARLVVVAPRDVAVHRTATRTAKPCPR